MFVLVLFRFDVKSGRRLTTHLPNGCHWICINFYLETCVTMIAGSVQQREAAVQVFPSSATPQGPAVDQRSQPFGPEECPDAANGHGTRTVSYARTDTHNGKIGIARVIRRLLAFYFFYFFFSLLFLPLFYLFQSSSLSLTLVQSSHISMACPYLVSPGRRFKNFPPGIKHQRNFLFF